MSVHPPPYMRDELFKVRGEIHFYPDGMTRLKALRKLLGIPDAETSLVRQEDDQRKLLALPLQTAATAIAPKTSRVTPHFHLSI